MPAHTHLRARAAVRRRRPPDPRQPRPAQRDVGRDDLVVGRRGRRAGRRPGGAGGRGDRRGLGVLLRRQHVVDRQRAGRHASTSCATGCCRSTGPGCRSGRLEVPDHRGGQRPRHRRRAVPRARLRPPVRRRGGQARRAVREARHARRHGRHLPAARGGRARPTPATCCSPAGSSTPTRRCGSGWSRGCIDPATFLDEVLATARGSPPPRRSPAGSPSSRSATAATPTSRPPAVGGDGAAGHAGHRGPPGGDPRPPGRSGRRSSAAAEPGRVGQ